MQVTHSPTQNSYKPLTTGGFLNPYSIVGEFGLREGMSIVDFGSGSGYFTILLSQKAGDAGRVYALDVLESALDSVRSKARVSNVNNVETIRADVEVIGSTGLSDNSQDFILMANILFQSRKKENIMKEAERILKNGGSLVVIDWMKDIGGIGPPENLRMDEIQMKSLITDAGFIFQSNINAGEFHYGMKFSKL